MCRLLGQLSAEPASAKNFLQTAEFSLLRQSNFKKSCLQRDGWGIGWFGSRGQPLIAKSPEPAYRDIEAFEDASHSAVSRVIIGHIRAASNPRGVNKARLINQANTQPFSDGRWLFAHNGTLQIPLETARALGPLRKRLQSQNDSEVYFWHLLKHLSKSSSVAQAAQACLLELWDIWESCKKRHPGKKAPYTSVNALLSDGTSLHAICHAASPGMAPFGVCNPAQPWTRMSFTRRGARLVIASENIDGGAWSAARPPEVLSAEIRSGGIELARGPLSGLPQMPLPERRGEAALL